MFNVEFLKSSPHFISKSLTRKEVLFDEWDFDENIYIIISGELSVEKYTWTDKKETKQLAVLRSNNFIGEWWLNWDFKKEVKIVATRNTELISINAQGWFSAFMEENSEEAKKVLSTVISITNKRLIDANKYITSVYQINNSIRDLEEINFKSIFKILDSINQIMESEFLLFLEVNPVMKEYLTLKYDSRKPWKMSDIIVEKWKYNLEDIWIQWEYKILTKEITLGRESLWNIIIARKNIFTWNEKRIFLALISSLSGVLKQKKIMKEENDKEFSKS